MNRIIYLILVLTLIACGKPVEVNKLELSTPSGELRRDRCSGAYTLTAKSQSGDLAPMDKDRSLLLFPEHYTDPNCGTKGPTHLLIKKGESAIIFYLKPSSTGKSTYSTEALIGDSIFDIKSIEKLTIILDVK